MGGTLDSWDQVLPALNNARQVLRYDTRGAGLSEKIHGRVTFDDMADDLAALLDALGIEGKVALAGTAVGGAIAIHFAVRHAARTGALVVTSPATGVAADRRQATLDRAAAAERDGMRALVEQGTANSYPPEVRHNAEEFRKFRARWLANDPQSFAAINRMLADFDRDRGTAAHRLSHAGDLAARTTGCARRPRSSRWQSRFPGAEYLEINSGHFAGIQTPGLVSQAFHGFLFAHGY